VLPLFFYQLNQILLYYNPFQNLKKVEVGVIAKTKASIAKEKETKTKDTVVSKKK